MCAHFFYPACCSGVIIISVDLYEHSHLLRGRLMSERFTVTGFLKPFVFVLTFFLVFVLFGYGRVNADNEDLNPDEVNLYFVNPYLQEVVGDIPSGYPTSYKINLTGLTGTPVFKVVKEAICVDVSADGLITPKLTKWYWVGNQGFTVYTEGAVERLQYADGESIVRVTCGNYTEDIKVNVIDYSTVFADNRVDAVL